MARYIFDIETNGLLPELNRVHCLAIKNEDTGERFSCNDQPGHRPTIRDGIRLLSEATEIIGHNVIGFDIPALAKVYGFTIPRERVSDTIVMAKLYKGNVKEEDLAPRHKGTDRGALFGQQSLKAWGIRLNCHKGDYEGGWDHWNKEMQAYCERDVEVT